MGKIFYLTVERAYGGYLVAHGATETAFALVAAAAERAIYLLYLICRVDNSLRLIIHVLESQFARYGSKV
jgi:tRNA A37 threonylcarbamoyladenosine synthetase subunit TsaC/SUA5/YrdC